LLSGSGECELEEPRAPLPARSSGARGYDEFQDLLSGVGAETIEPTEATERDRKDMEIAELRRHLEMLRPIGDQLALVEQRRLKETAKLQEEIEELKARRAVPAAISGSTFADLPEQLRLFMWRISELDSGLEQGSTLRREQWHRICEERDRLEDEVVDLRARLAESQSQHPRPDADSEGAPTGSRDETARLEREVRRLAATLFKRETALERQNDRLASLRSRCEEQKRKASERWAEIRGLRGRVNGLEQELKQLRKE